MGANALALRQERAERQIGETHARRHPLLRAEVAAIPANMSPERSAVAFAISSRRSQNTWRCDPMV